MKAAFEVSMMRKRILLVDDNPTLLAMLQLRLEHNGYAVETAGNGREALAKVAQANYDAVLLDYRMPGIDGLAVLQHIRAHYPSLPVVMMTGDKRSPVANQALAAGAQACLLKPFDRLDLEKVMK
jgi:CheY-like chemotaxis protein